jgi:putative ABC transport system permease protein
VGALVAPRLAASSGETMLGAPTVAANPWHMLVAACPVLLVLVAGTWASTRRRTRLGVVDAIQSGVAAPALGSREVRSFGRFTTTAPVDLGVRNLLAVRSRTAMLAAALIVTGSAVVFALSMQASLDARPKGEVSDVPDGLPILVYTLDVLLLAIATLSLVAVALLSVRERTREFGVLKTLGFTPRQVIVSVMSGHALLALLAGVLSVPLGIALYAAVYAASGGSGEDRVLPAWWWLVLVVVGVVALTSAAISLPARLATRMGVAEALRYE